MRLSLPFCWARADTTAERPRAPSVVMTERRSNRPLRQNWLREDYTPPYSSVKLGRSGDRLVACRSVGPTARGTGRGIATLVLRAAPSSYVREPVLFDSRRLHHIPPSTIRKRAVRRRFHSSHSAVRARLHAQTGRAPRARD